MAEKEIVLNEEELIREAFVEKGWNEIQSQDSWQILKTVAEFVDGFDRLAKIGPCVTIYGSARTKPDHKYYLLSDSIYVSRIVLILVIVPRNYLRLFVLRLFLSTGVVQRLH